MMQYFEWYLPSDCMHWKNLGSRAESLRLDGITALWLPPATKGAFGKDGVGYAVYDLYDLGEFDQKGSVPTKYGTKDEYLAAVKACQKAGIEVYADIVLNHKIGADASEMVVARECKADNRKEMTCADKAITAWTLFNFPGRKGRYSDFIWNSTCFDGVDWDDASKRNGVYLFKDHTWQNGVDNENGNYDYLMGADLDFDRPYVVEELIRWGKWYIDTTGVDGFRLDAVKHIKAEFYKEWLSQMRTYAGKDMFAVGEYWSKDVKVLENYMEQTGGSLSLFDVPLHMNFYNASVNGRQYDMRQIFAGSFVAENPMHAVTFVDNHDTQPGQALFSYVSAWFKPHAYALILLREAGYPCVFYGDYAGILHDNLAPVEELKILLMCRQKYAYGKQKDYFDDAHIVGFTREESGMAVLLSATGDGKKIMNVGTAFSARKYADILKNTDETVIIDKDGNAEFTVKDGKVSVWLPEDI